MLGNPGSCIKEKKINISSKTILEIGDMGVQFFIEENTLKLTNNYSGSLNYTLFVRLNESRYLMPLVLAGEVRTRLFGVEKISEIML